MIQKGDLVFVPARVSRVPDEDTNLYRLEIEGSKEVLWSTADRMMIRHNGSLIRADEFIKREEHKREVEEWNRISDLWED